MPDITPFPKAPDQEELYILGGALYNRIVETIEALSRLKVATPLYMSDGPGGRTIAISNLPGMVEVKLSAPDSSGTGGFYSGQIYPGPIDITQTDDTALGDLPGPDDALIIYPLELGTFITSLPTGSNTLPMTGFLVPVFTKETYPRRVVILTTAIDLYLYGQLTSDWSTGNYVNVQPVMDLSGTPFPTPPATQNVLLYGVGRSNSPFPAGACALLGGDVIVYKLMNPGNPTSGIMVNPPAFDQRGAQYQVLPRDANLNVITDDVSARPV